VDVEVGPAVPGGSRNILRVLLVTASDDELRTLGVPLHRDGIAVTRVRDAAGAAEALHAGGYDAALLSHPLPDADVIGSCALLSRIPGAPPLLLLDALDPNELTIPGTIRPARMLRKPVDAAKLAALLRKVVAESEAAPGGPVATALDFAGALLELANARETGVLEVQSEALRTRIFLREGAVVSAEGGSLRETLGRMLLRHGTLSEVEYTRVIERMTEKVIANEHQRMGEVLVELGLLSAEEVHQALRAQVLEKVAACFAFPSPAWSFSELDELPDGLEPFAIPPMPTLVLAGLREHARPELLAAWLAPHAALRPRLEWAAHAVQERLGGEGDALRVLERIDGSHSLGVLAREAPDAQALLATLLLVGAIGVAGAAPNENARPATRPAERRTTARVTFAREVVGRRKAPIAGAPASNGPAAAATPADRGQARLEAEQCFRRGRELLDAEKPLEAVKLLRRAVELEPGEPEYALAEAWASYLEARHGVRVARAKALTSARRLLEADPKATKAHTILGRLALDDGERERATREFELALLRDPEDAEAKHGLKQSRS
jgi:DNA-binding response OmpR family regulator/tetratricopeptide (TPR) repeat protein